MNPVHQLPSFKVIFEESINIYKKNARMSIVVALLPSIFLASIDIIRPSFAATPFALGFLFALEVVCTLIYIYVAILAPYMLVRIAHMSATGTTPATIDDLFIDSQKHFWNLLFLTFIILTVIIGSGTMFIIPFAIAFIYICFSLPAYMLDGVKSFKALAYSAWYVHGRFWQIALRVGILTLIILAFLGAMAGLIAIPFVEYMKVAPVANYVTQIIFSVIWIPLSTNFFYVVYTKLKTLSIEPVPEAFISKAQKYFVTLVTVTVIAYVVLIATSGYTGFVHPLEEIIKRNILTLF